MPYIRECFPPSYTKVIKHLTPSCTKFPKPIYFNNLQNYPIYVSHPIDKRQNYVNPN